MIYSFQKFLKKQSFILDYANVRVIFSADAFFLA